MQPLVIPPGPSVFTFTCEASGHGVLLSQIRAPVNESFCEFPGIPKEERDKNWQFLLASSPALMSGYEGTIKYEENSSAPSQLAPDCSDSCSVPWPLLWRPCSQPYRALKLPVELLGFPKTGLQHARQAFSCPRRLLATHLLSDVIYACAFFHICPLEARASWWKEPMPEKVQCTKHTGDKGKWAPWTLPWGLAGEEAVPRIAPVCPCTRHRQVVRAEVGTLPTGARPPHRWRACV